MGTGTSVSYGHILPFFFYESVSASQSIKELSNMYKVKPVLRGHLWDKEKVAL
jgi:hypothetical protein